MRQSSKWPLFLIGLFSSTQIKIVAYMDISELFSFIFGPIFLLMDWPQLKRDGFGRFIGLLFLTVLGAGLAGYVNDSHIQNYLRGLLIPIAIICLTCVFHHFLMKDFGSFKWFFLGVAISGVISIFIFQRGTAIGYEGATSAEATENTLHYSLFWFVQLATWLTLPFYMFYLKTPKWYIVLVSIFLLIFSVFSAGSRSSLGVLVVSIFMLLIGGKKRDSMRTFRKYFWYICALALLTAPLIMGTYKYLAVHNYLGETAYKKYMAQTERGTDMLHILMGGRAEFFVGLTAAIKHPIIGYGYGTRDKEGVTLSFIEKWGSDASLKDYHYFFRLGFLPPIPAHSWVISFWVWYGIVGLIFMFYMGWLMFSTLRNRLHVVPELYGYFAYLIPGLLWHWLFSPFGARTSNTFLFVLLIMVKAIAEGRFHYMSELDRQKMEQMMELRAQRPVQ